MLGLMGIGASFINAAGRGGKPQKNVLSFIAGDADLMIKYVSCEGEIVVSTTKNGAAHTETYSDLEETTVSLSNDANTLVTITGNVVFIYFYDEDEDPETPVNISDLNVKKCKSLTILNIAWCQNLTSLDLSANTALTYFDCNNCTGLTSLDLSANTALTNLNCSGCTGLTSLDLSANTAFTNLNCSGCTGLTSLDLSANTALVFLDCNGCTGLTSLDLSANTALTNLSCLGCTGLTIIKYPATNSSVSTAIANAITNATAADGTVYTDSDGAYYSTIADAATAKGWTIEQL